MPALAELPLSGERARSQLRPHEDTASSPSLRWLVEYLERTLPMFVVSGIQAGVFPRGERKIMAGAKMGKKFHKGTTIQTKATQK